MSSARRDLCGGRPEPHWPLGLTGEGPFLPRPLPVEDGVGGGLGYPHARVSAEAEIVEASL